MAGALQVEQAMLELSDGLRFAVRIDRYTMVLLPLLDGDRPLAHALETAAGSLDLTPEAERRLIPAALPVIRKLLELGFFELARAGG